MKKKIIVVAVAAIVAVGAAWNVSQANKSEVLSDVSLDNIEALANECFSGGVGARSCSHSGTVEILGNSVSYSCTVSCYGGYYACCSLTCNCEKSS